MLAVTASNKLVSATIALVTVVHCLTSYVQKKVQSDALISRVSDWTLKSLDLKLLIKHVLLREPDQPTPADASHYVPAARIKW